MLLWLLLVPVILVAVAVIITLTFFLAVLAYVCWQCLIHNLRDPVLERYEDVCAIFFAETRSKRLLRRVCHLKCHAFHAYYHGAKPQSHALYQGLSIVCDWWRQQQTGMPAPCLVYLRLTCKTLADMESLAARQLTIRAPLLTPNVTTQITSPARRWKTVQAVSYMHRPEQLPALLVLAAAWPNLRQLQISKPHHTSWKLSHLVTAGSHASSSSSTGGDSSIGASLAGAGLVGEDMLARLQAAGASAEQAAAASAQLAAGLIGSAGSSSSSSTNDDDDDDVCDGHDSASNVTKAPNSSSSSSGTIQDTASRHSSRSRDQDLGSSSDIHTAAAAAIHGPETTVLHLVAGLVVSASHWPYLQTLSLSQLGLTPAAARLLAHAAHCWPLLRSCNVSNNSLGTAGIMVLLEAAVSHWHQLQVLDLRGDTGAEGAAVTAAAAATTCAGGSASPESNQQQQQLLQQLLLSCAVEGTAEADGSFLCRHSSSGAGAVCSTSMIRSGSRRLMLVTPSKSALKLGALPGGLPTSPQHCSAALQGGLNPSQWPWGLGHNGDVPTSYMTTCTAGVCARWHPLSHPIMTCCAAASSTGGRSGSTHSVLCSSCTAPQQLPLLLLLL